MDDSFQHFNSGRKHNKEDDEAWYKLSTKYKNPSSFGKLMKLHFNRYVEIFTSS